MSIYIYSREMSKKIRDERHGLDDDMGRNWALEINLYSRQGSLKVNRPCSYHEHVLLRLLPRVKIVENGAEWRVMLPGPFAVFFFSCSLFYASFPPGTG